MQSNVGGVEFSLLKEMAKGIWPWAVHRSLPRLKTEAQIPFGALLISCSLGGLVGLHHPQLQVLD